MVDFHKIFYGGDAIQGDRDAIIFNPIASTILKLLRFKISDLQPCSAIAWDWK
jgi:hypothetical protein